LLTLSAFAAIKSVFRLTKVHFIQP